MKIHEDFINAISYPILSFLAEELNARKVHIDDKFAIAIQVVVEESIRNGIVDVANQVEDIEALVIAALRSPRAVRIINSDTCTNIALDAVNIAKKCREGITKHVRETRNDSESNPLLD